MDPTKLIQIGPTTGPGAVRTGTAPLRPEEAAPGFQALLEKLEATAGALAARELDHPDHLAGAVEDARASLESALDLGRELVEAYRQARLAGGSDAA